ncbi:MAG: hypothetical protein K2Q22_10690, partial [Cytophagales bacterium]|nr:hypothetical protein [Cytophagales bacterium]
MNEKIKKVEIIEFKYIKLRQTNHEFPPDAIWFLRAALRQLPLLANRRFTSAYVSSMLWLLCYNLGT